MPLLRRWMLQRQQMVNSWCCMAGSCGSCSGAVKSRPRCARACACCTDQAD